MTVRTQIIIAAMVTIIGIFVVSLLETGIRVYPFAYGPFFFTADRGDAIIEFGRDKLVFQGLTSGYTGPKMFRKPYGAMYQDGGGWQWEGMTFHNYSAGWAIGALPAENGLPSTTWNVRADVGKYSIGPYAFSIDDFGQRLKTDGHSFAISKKPTVLIFKSNGAIQRVPS